MVLFGLALMAGGAGVLVVLRDELGIRLPAFLAAPLDRWSLEALLARLPPDLLRRVRQQVGRPPRTVVASRAVGRASVSGHTVVQSATQTAVQERVRRRLQTERAARPSQPPPEAVPEETRRQRPVSLPRAVGRATPPPSSRSHPDPGQ